MTRWWSDRMGKEGKEGRKKGRKKSKSLWVLPFWHKHIICAWRQRGRTRDETQWNGNSGDQRTLHFFAVDAANRSENPSVWARSGGGDGKDFLFHLSAKVSVNGTVQTSPQLRCFSDTGGTEVGAAANSNSHISSFEKKARRVQERCEWDFNSWKDEAKRQDSGCQVWKMEGLRCAGCNKCAEAAGRRGGREASGFLRWKS